MLCDFRGKVMGKSWAFYGFHSVSIAMLVASFSPSQCYTNQPAFIEDFPLMNSVAMLNYQRVYGVIYKNK